jgi:apolipoprotein N-acyltransferase
MKNINKLNYFFVGVPTILCLAGIFNEKFLFFGMLSTILTGLFQVVMAIKMLIDEPHNKQLQIYIAAVVFYFTTWIVFPEIEYKNILKFGLVIIPILLAFYLSIIIYKKARP